MKSRTVFWLVVGLLLVALNWKKRWNQEDVLTWDGGGYLSYLPAAFLYHNPGRPDSLAVIVQQHTADNREHSLSRLGMQALPNGNYATKYPLGMALSQLPWFGGAHLYARLQDWPDNGFSWPYQQAALLSGFAYACLGLWVVRKLLLRYFPDDTVAWTLAGIGLGTNFFVYASHEAAMSHPVLFLWQASLLYCTARWYETPRRRWAAGIGLFLGLAVLTRFSEAAYVLVPLAWGLSSAAAWRARPARWARHAGQLALALVLGAGVVSLQFFFWHYVGGHWLLDAYRGEHFDFGNPHILAGLFSIRKGWFVYTPLAALVLAAGLPPLRRAVPAALPALLLPAVLYLTFSWEQWWYGWGFSARPLVSLYPLLALPLAAVVAATRAAGPAARWRKPVQRVLIACIILNQWQGWQYVNNILPGDEVTAQLYRERFFKGPPLSVAWATPLRPPKPLPVW